MMNVDFTELLLGLLAILLIVAAVIDVRTFTISNGLNAAVALLAPVYWWSIGLLVAGRGDRGRGRGRSLRRPRRHILHGDGRRRRQLAAALALVQTIRHFENSCHHVAGRRHPDPDRAFPSQKRGKAPIEGEAETARPEVPYGVPIAIGALWILAQRFLNQFA